jgi:hypothetical protein
MRKFKSAINELAVIKGNVLKFNGIENAIREDHVVVVALKNSGACKSLGGNGE